MNNYDTDELFRSKETALLVFVEKNDYFRSYKEEELENLAKACGIECSGIVFQHLKHPHPYTYVGTGKLDEIKTLLASTESNVVICNNELTPSQLRNLEDALSCKVIDRTMLILDIFESRAQTKESKLQVEIAKLSYFLPRLIGLRASLGRQRGGVGSRNRGAGEKKLELDRRRIEHEIVMKKKELQILKSERKLQRQKRIESSLPKIALVGYTNAGKSTLLNTLLQISEEQQRVKEEKYVFEKDMLFATLQTSTRKVECFINDPILITDTVGFVSDLPHHLIEAFKSTLEEINDADFLVHVIDAHHPHAKQMIETTHHVLQDIGINSHPMIYLLNKSEIVEEQQLLELQNFISMHPLYEKETYEVVSGTSKTQEGIHNFLEVLDAYVHQDEHEYSVKLPYTLGNISAFIHLHTHHIEEHYDTEGIHFSFRTSEQTYQRILRKINETQEYI